MTDNRIRILASGQGIYRVTRGHVDHGVIRNAGLKGRWLYSSNDRPDVEIDVTAALHDDNALSAIIDRQGS